MDHQRMVLRRQKEVHEKLSLLLQKDGKHSAFAQMTITRVKLSSPMTTAKIYYLLLDGHKLILEGQLKAKALWLQSRLGHSLGYKNSPVLEFVYDRGYEHALKIDTILGEINAEKLA